MKEVIEEVVFELCAYLADNGAKLYLVGGMPRDYLLYGCTPKIDYDIEIYNIELEQLINLIEIKNYRYKLQGNFGVIKFLDFDVELAIPRKENKIGVKHTDFLINLDPFMSKEEAIMRRDFHINTIMYNIINDEFYITNEAKFDLQYRQLRHVSEKFCEDPLRVIRAIRFSVTHNLTIADVTLDLCRNLSLELNTISEERIKQEFKKILKAEYLNSNFSYLNLYFHDYLGLNELNNIKFTDNLYVNIYILANYYHEDAIKKLFSKNDFKYVNLLKKFDFENFDQHNRLYEIAPINEFESDIINSYCVYLGKSKTEINTIFKTLKKISVYKKKLQRIRKKI